MKKFLFAMFGAFVIMGLVCSAASVTNSNLQKPAEENGEEVTGFMGASLSGTDDMKVVLTPLYQKLQTCSPVQSKYLTIYGIKSGRCHFNYNFYDCNVPLSVAQKFSTNAMKTIKNTPEDEKNPQYLKNDYIDSIINNQSYCIQK